MTPDSALAWMPNCSQASLLPAECMVAGVRQEEKEREPCAGTHADRHIHTFFFLHNYISPNYISCMLIVKYNWLAFFITDQYLKEEKFEY